MAAEFGSALAGAFNRSGAVHGYKRLPVPTSPRAKRVSRSEFSPASLSGPPSGRYQGIERGARRTDAQGRTTHPHRGRPEDYIAHTAHQLIDRAAALDYDALGITLHNRQLDLEPLSAYAGRNGLVLIPGVERDIQGKHVLLINFSGRAERVDSFEAIAALKKDEPVGLVIAPHPFFPARSCLRSVMDRHASLFDAVEYNAMYSPMVNFNRTGKRWALAHGTPMVGNGDVHLLEQLGTTYSLVDAEPTPNAICEAIRLGRVSVESVPLHLIRAAWLFARILPSGVLEPRGHALAR